MSPLNPSRYRKVSRLVVFVSLCFLLHSPCPADAPDNNLKREMTRAVEAVRPALLRIHIVSTVYQQGREFKTEVAGSGVIISPEGYAITNHHVAMNAERILCTLADKRELEARLVGTDPLADIAVIKLVSSNGKPLPAATFGDSSKLEVGDRVFAMGSPLALSQSVTMGIVSNTEMVMPEFFGSEGLELEGEDVGSIVRWIGHDALIRGGNSGGPLVDREGRVVGINEISFGLSGAIPSDLARSVAQQIIKSGKVTRSWIGLEAQPLLTSSELSKGVLVSGVLDGSPAQKAGFRSGDVILNLAGKDITAHFREEMPVFNQFVADLPVGKSVKARVLRDGKEITLTVTTEERRKASDREHELKDWGICVTNITFLSQKEMQIESQEGVIVTSVQPSGPAGSAKPPISEKDVIIGVGETPIRNVAHLRSVTQELIGKREQQVPVVDLIRGKKRYASVVKLGKKEKSQPGSEVRKAWIGIDLQVLTRELAQALGVPDSTGVRVTQVFHGAEAEKAGLRVGDLITKLDGEKITACEVGDEEIFPAMIRQYDIGADAVLDVMRDGKPIQVTVKLEPSPKPAGEYPTYDDDNFGFTVRDIAFADRAGGRVSRDQTGAYVESVSDGSWAALGNLQAGDVIAEIDARKIESLRDFKAAINEVAQKKPGAVVLKVRRGIHTVFLEFKPSWDDSGASSR